MLDLTSPQPSSVLGGFTPMKGFLVVMALEMIHSVYFGDEKNKWIKHM